MRAGLWQMLHLGAVGLCCFALVVLGAPNFARAGRFFAGDTASSPAALEVVIVAAWAIAVATTAVLFGFWLRHSVTRRGTRSTAARLVLATSVVVFALGVQRHVAGHDALCCGESQQKVRMVIQRVP